MITIAAGPPSFIPAFMLVVSMIFLCLGVFYLSPQGSAWARSRVQRRHARLATDVDPLAWARGHEARLTRLLALIWVVAGSAIALVCILALALG
ncbi:hypothetical protein [Streptomyces sp. NBC_00306]|uniref:hypothetical protein n=1 Tax=Streptomyces sp. NBC_00306 TaxID=2975708 RepID=UPI002E2E1669|nr:hypothetical protein [Streptomyces sp. NBC_00306]